MAPNKSTDGTYFVFTTQTSLAVCSNDLVWTQHIFLLNLYPRNQVCVAYTGQVMPIWVHSTSLIALQVLSVETPGGSAAAAAAAAACVRLTADTEVAVTPKPRQRRRLREGERSELPWLNSVRR